MQSVLITFYSRQKRRHFSVFYRVDNQTKIKRTFYFTDFSRLSYKKSSYTSLRSPYAPEQWQHRYYFSRAEWIGRTRLDWNSTSVNGWPYESYAQSDVAASTRAVFRIDLALFSYCIHEPPWSSRWLLRHFRLRRPFHAVLREFRPLLSRACPT